MSSYLEVNSISLFLTGGDLREVLDLLRQLLVDFLDVGHDLVDQCVGGLLAGPVLADLLKNLREIFQDFSQGLL